MDQVTEKIRSKGINTEMGFLENRKRAELGSKPKSLFRKPGETA